MIDSEVERLRRLRATALRVRAIARALRTTAGAEHATVERGACAAWRAARTVSGRLRAHPFAKFQKDASLTVVLKNAVAAKGAVIRVALGGEAIALVGAALQGLARELSDARALTWATELSDSLGRSQAEIGSILAQLGFDSRVSALGALTQPRIASVTSAGDWPYIAL